MIDVAFHWSAGLVLKGNYFARFFISGSKFSTKVDTKYPTRALDFSRAVFF